MSLQPTFIGAYSKGLELDKKPFLLNDTAFSDLENAYVWRDRVKKREGIQLLNRLGRFYSELSLGTSPASPWDFNLLVEIGYVANITKSNPGVVTTKYAHNLTTGDKVTFSNVLGMTQVNDQTYPVTVTGAKTFQIVDTSGFTDYTSGGLYISNRSLLGLGSEPNAELQCGIFDLVIGTGLTAREFEDLNGDGVLLRTDANYTTAITNIVRGLTTTITIPGHTFNPGDVVGFENILGTIQLNGQYGTIISTVPGTSITISKNTSIFFSNYISGGNAYLVSGSINYITGAVHVVYPGVAAVSHVTFRYFPSLPSMGIWQRDLGPINAEQTIFFDTKYAYIFTGNVALGTGGFQEFIPGTTWAGTDSDFFFSSNYRGSTPASRLFFTTNFVNDDADPIRYTDGSTWTDFAPVIGTTVQTDALPNTGGAGTVLYNGTLTRTPVMPGTVVITVVDAAAVITHVFTDAFQPVVNNTTGTLVGSISGDNGTINYITGAFTLNFNPALAGASTVSATYNYGSTFLFQAKVLVPYYGRMLAVNTWEGSTRAGAVNIPNRVRFCQIGDPTALDAWRTDTFGKGGFIDAPTAESAISANFFKNTMITGFERSTWQLRYVGEYGLPYLWERISSDFGTESTFSAVLFDQGVVSVGDRAIVRSDGVSVERIDEVIPDQVFDFRNAEDGTKRIYAIRDFQKELIFWSYVDSELAATDSPYPNRVLVYNYRNSTWAKFRDSITCFGTFQPVQDPYTWDSLTIFWDDTEITWDSVDSQSQFPVVTSGNQQGFIHLYNYVQMNEPSLSVSGVGFDGTTTTLIIHNHNLEQLENIYVTDLSFVDVNNLPLTSNLNNSIFQLQVADVNTIRLYKWNSVAQQYENVPLSPNPGTYIGCGRVTLLPKLYVQTKDFNPFQGASKQMFMSFIDFLTDSSPSSAMTVMLYVNADLSVQGNLLVGNIENETYLTQPFYTPQSDYAWHRFYATCVGQYVRVVMTYDDTLMNNITTHQQQWVLEAMNVWSRPAGKLVF